jgi:DNA-binding MarR family transcriptional regulator
LLPVRAHSPLPTLDAHLGYWLRRVSNEVSGAFARALQTEGVSAAEWVALRLLHGEAKRTPGDLAGLTGMTRGAVTKVLDKLEAKALVTRAVNPEDNRVQWLSLTRSGQRLVPKLAALADRNDAHFFGCLSTAEQRALQKLLEKLTDFHRLREVPVD